MLELELLELELLELEDLELDVEGLPLVLAGLLSLGVEPGLQPVIKRPKQASAIKNFVFFISKLLCFADIIVKQ